MKFTDIFIKKPVLATVINVLILILGLKSIFDLDLRQYPKVENTTITVTTAYPGASPEVIQGFITTPLQTSIASADGIDFITASSSLGVSTITAVLRLNFDASVAFTDILAKVNAAKGRLPRNASDPVIVKSSGSTLALLYVNYASKKLNSQQIYDYLNRVVQPKLQSVAGVSSADILGGNPFAMRLWLHPEKMAALSVSADDVNNAILKNNYIAAAGQLKGVNTITPLNLKTDLHSADEFKDLVIRQYKGKLVHMRDIATVELGAEGYESSITFNGTKGVFIGVNALPNANPLTVIKNVLKELPGLQKQLPPSLEQTVVYDATQFISASIRDVIHTLIEAAGIVIVVIFLFLGSLRSVLIPVVTIPLSLVGVCFVMMILGYSINLLTLLAMVLAIGLVVDDAIVVLENIHRHIEEGNAPLQAALIGAREIAMPVITMTITLAAVYAPIAFTGGVTGALFKEFALTLAASVFVSGIVALTLSPMMCSFLLKPQQKTDNFAHKIDVFFNRLQGFYAKKLSSVINHKAEVIIFGAAIFLSLFLLYALTPKELAPKEDKGFLFGLITGPTTANLEYTEKYKEQLRHLMEKVPERAADFQILMNYNSGFAGLILKPWNERKRTPVEIIPALQREMNNVTGLKVFLLTPPDLPTGTGGTPIQFVLRTIDDHKVLYKTMEELRDRVTKSGKFMFSFSDLDFDKPELNLTVDRTKAGEMGVSMDSIGSTLTTLLGGNYTDFFTLNGRSYKIIPQLPDLGRSNPSDIYRAYVRAANGSLVPLSNFIHFSTSVRPNSLNQFQQLNSATLSAVALPNVSTDQALAFLNQTADEIMPKGMTYDYAGELRVFVKEGSTLMYTFLFALVMIFLALSAQFESFRDPLVILLSVPMAICGALVFLFLGVATINIYTQIGLVTLIGLITKHGILMVDFANKLREEENLDISSAIQKAASVRLRPILMTTAAMVLGVVPLLVATGAGAASRFSIGIVIATGLTIGTLFTLFVVPTMYTLITSKKERTSR